MNQDQAPAPNSAKSKSVQPDTKVKNGIKLGTVNFNLNQNPPLEDYQFISNPSTVRFNIVHHHTASSPKFILQQTIAHQPTASDPRHILSNPLSKS